jgi:hypothetical protein
MCPLGSISTNISPRCKIIVPEVLRSWHPLAGVKYSARELSSNQQVVNSVLPEELINQIDLTNKSEQASVDEGNEEEYWGDEGLLNLNTELENHHREQ